MYIPAMPRQPVAIETSELRKRVRAAIEHSRKHAAARRTKLDEAAASYQSCSDPRPFHSSDAINTLRAEGFNFTVFTPTAASHGARAIG